jgi:hypothetical protein
LLARALPSYSSFAPLAKSAEEARSIAEEARRLLDGLPLVVAKLYLLPVLALVSTNTFDSWKIK